jgi:peptidoglycan/xylan/chitin deacetylase (PgdA/CDA1 family)
MIEHPPPWPNDARCAVAFSFDVDADSIVHVNFAGRLDRELHALAYMRYDPLVAVPRLVRLFADYAIPVSYFVPGWVIEHYPAAIDCILSRDNEIAHHGYLHEWPNKQTPDEQRGALERGIGLIERATGARPRGYRSPYYGLSQHTVDLLIEAGFDYESSLFADDVPILLDNGRGDLVELPVPAAVDDYNQYVSSRAFDHLMTISSPRQALEVFQAEFDAMWEFGGLWVGVWHPAVSGRLSRALAIRSLIEHMLAKGRVWFATHAQVAAHVRKLVAEGRWQPRVDRLPYYEEGSAAATTSR